MESEEGSLLDLFSDEASDAGGLGCFFCGGATENSLGWNLFTGGGEGPEGAGIHPSCLYRGIGVGKVSIGIIGGVGDGEDDASHVAHDMSDSDTGDFIL
jgi:hypothetical protein